MQHKCNIVQTWQHTIDNSSVSVSVRRRRKNIRLVVEVESLASSSRKLRRVDVKA